MGSKMKFDDFSVNGDDRQTMKTTAFGHIIEPLSGS